MQYTGKDPFDAYSPYLYSIPGLRLCRLKSHTVIMHHIKKINDPNLRDSSPSKLVGRFLSSI